MTSLKCKTKAKTETKQSRISTKNILKQQAEKKKDILRQIKLK